MGDSPTLRHPAQLRRLIDEGVLAVPGASNALTARVIQEAGFRAVYVSGAGIANSYLGVPDIGLVTLTELALHLAAVRRSVDIPVIVDADTGFGNPIGVIRAVQTLEDAGANAIQLEDQESPKRCGHFDHKRVVDTEEMVQKVRAAVHARRDPETLIIARTDALASHGFDEAVNRARAYRSAGADLTFVEAPETIDQMERIPTLLDCPQVANLVIGGETPLLDLDRLGEMGFGMVLYANVVLQAAVQGMQEALRPLAATGSLTGVLDRVITWDERQSLVRKPHFDGLEERFSTESAVLSPPVSDVQREERS